MDVKRQEVSVRLIGIFGIVALVWYISSIYLKLNLMDPISWGAGLLPGIILLLIGKVTKEAVGYGDGITMLVCGLFLGFTGSLGLLFTALLLSAFYSLVLLVIWKEKKNYTIPFLPFLLGAYMVFLMAGQLEGA